MTRTPGSGSVRTHVKDQRRIVVAFDEATFGEVREHAVKGKLSFAAAVRELVEWGLLSADEDAA